MKQDYCSFSSLTIDELENNIINSSKEILTTDGNSFLYNLKNNKNLIYQAFKSYDNTDLYELASKINFFSPHMLRIISSSNYKSCLEYLGGFGVMSELMLEVNSKLNVTYSNIDSEILDFTKYRIGNKISILKLNNNCYINNKYDIIISDGNLQYFSKKDQQSIINNLSDNLNPDGMLCLLIDISGKKSSPLYHDVDIDIIHSNMSNDLKCIYGKNTFSSLWKKQN